MPSDLTVSRVGAAAPLSGERGPAASPPGAAKPAAHANTALPNPSLRLDPGLAMVVIEFRDDSGTVRNSIPSQQQLDAYRAWDRSHAGPAPHPDRGVSEDSQAKTPPSPQVSAGTQYGGINEAETDPA